MLTNPRTSEDLRRAHRADVGAGIFAHASGIMLLTPDGRISRYFYGVEYPSRDVRLGLVDASAAFFRAAFPTAGGGSPVYRSGGHIRVEPAPAGSQGVQG